jgi:flagellar motor switch/type III secretory pathway protein FliN
MPAQSPVSLKKAWMVWVAQQPLVPILAQTSRMTPQPTTRSTSVIRQQTLPSSARVSTRLAWMAAIRSGADFGGDFGVPDLDGPAATAGNALVQDFGSAPSSNPGVKIGASGSTNRVDLVLGIPIDVQIILGSSRMAVSTLMNLSEGATIALDRKIWGTCGYHGERQAYRPRRDYSSRNRRHQVRRQDHRSHRRTAEEVELI